MQWKQHKSCKVQHWKVSKCQPEFLRASLILPPGEYVLWSSFNYKVAYYYFSPRTPASARHRMDGAHLMSSYSICSFILIAWRLAPGLIYCTLLRHGSKDRIIHFLLHSSAAPLTLSEHIRNFNESLQHPKRSRVNRPLFFLSSDLQHFHFSFVLTSIWLAFSSSLSKETFSFKRPRVFLLADCCGWNFFFLFFFKVQFLVATQHRKLQSLWQSNKLCKTSAAFAGTRAANATVSYRSCE